MFLLKSLPTIEEEGINYLNSNLNHLSKLEGLELILGSNIINN